MADSLKEESIKEIKIKEDGNLFIAIIVLILLISIGIVSYIAFEFTGLVLGFFILLLVAFYIIVLSFLLEPKMIKEIV